MFESISNINDLKAAILSINVKDYGDFKRKVVLYLNRFLEEKKLNAEQREALSKIIDNVQFQNHTVEIEKMRYWSLDQLNKLTLS